MMRLSKPLNSETAMGRDVLLVFATEGARSVALAPLTGHDESRATTAMALLQRLALPGDQLVHGAALERLTLGDRDRAIAGLYTQLYGTDVRADAQCATCKAKFEIRFDLDALQESRKPDGCAKGVPPTLRLDGSRLRLPTQADLDGAPDGFLKRLTLDGPVPDQAAAAVALEAADPALELDLSGTCPECETTQAVPFSIQRFLEAAMSRDRSFLMREVHLIASAYHWGLSEILSLTRQDRQNFARLLIADREAASLPLRRAS